MAKATSKKPPAGKKSPQKKGNAKVNKAPSRKEVIKQKVKAALSVKKSNKNASKSQRSSAVKNPYCPSVKKAKKESVTPKKTPVSVKKAKKETAKPQPQVKTPKAQGKKDIKPKSPVKTPVSTPKAKASSQKPKAKVLQKPKKAPANLKASKTLIRNAVKRAKETKQSKSPSKSHKKETVKQTPQKPAAKSPTAKSLAKTPVKKETPKAQSPVKRSNRRESRQTSNVGKSPVKASAKSKSVEGTPKKQISASSPKAGNATPKARSSSKTQRESKSHIKEEKKAPPTRTDRSKSRNESKKVTETASPSKSKTASPSAKADKKENVRGIKETDMATAVSRTGRAKTRGETKGTNEKANSREQLNQRNESKGTKEQSTPSRAERAKQRHGKQESTTPTKRAASSSPRGQSRKALKVETDKNGSDDSVTSPRSKSPAKSGLKAPESPSKPAFAMKIQMKKATTQKKSQSNAKQGDSAATKELAEKAVELATNKSSQTSKGEKSTPDSVSFQPLQDEPHRILCLDCGMPFYDRRTLTHHKRAECKPIFDLKKTNVSGASKMLESPDSKRMWVCTQCGERCVSESSLSEHRKQCTANADSRMIKCTYCSPPLWIPGFPVYFAHMKEVHKNVQPGQKLFMCSKCSDLFVNMGDLEKHRKVGCESGTSSKKAEVVRCHECNTLFKDAPSYIQHQPTCARSHTGTSSGVRPKDTKAERGLGSNAKVASQFITELSASTGMQSFAIKIDTSGGSPKVTVANNAGVTDSPPHTAESSKKVQHQQASSPVKLNMNGSDKAKVIGSLNLLNAQPVGNMSPGKMAALCQKAVADAKKIIKPPPQMMKKVDISAATETKSPGSNSKSPMGTSTPKQRPPQKRRSSSKSDSAVKTKLLQAKSATGKSIMVPIAITQGIHVKPVDEEKVMCVECNLEMSNMNQVTNHACARCLKCNEMMESILKVANHVCHAYKEPPKPVQQWTVKMVDDQVAKPGNDENGQCVETV